MPPENIPPRFAFQVKLFYPVPHYDFHFHSFSTQSTSFFEEKLGVTNCQSWKITPPRMGLAFLPSELIFYFSNCVFYFQIFLGRLRGQQP